LHKILPKTQQSSSRRRGKRLRVGRQGGGKVGGNLRLGRGRSSGGGTKGPCKYATIDSCVWIYFIPLCIFYVHTRSHSRICIENVFRAFPLQGGKYVLPTVLGATFRLFTLPFSIERHG